MTESSPTTEVTVAEKRAALQRAGYEVGSRGKLSAEAEQQYAELAAASPNSQA